MKIEEKRNLVEKIYELIKKVEFQKQAALNFPLRGKLYENEYFSLKIPDHETYLLCGKRDAEYDHFAIIVPWRKNNFYTFMKILEDYDLIVIHNKDDQKKTYLKEKNNSSQASDIIFEPSECWLLMSIHNTFKKKEILIDFMEFSNDYCIDMKQYLNDDTKSEKK